MSPSLATLRRYAEATGTRLTVGLERTARGRVRRRWVEPRSYGGAVQAVTAARSEGRLARSSPQLRDCAAIQGQDQRHQHGHADTHYNVASSLESPCRRQNLIGRAGQAMVRLILIVTLAAQTYPARQADQPVPPLSEELLDAGALPGSVTARRLQGSPIRSVSQSWRVECFGATNPVAPDHFRKIGSGQVQ